MGSKWADRVHGRMNRRTLLVSLLIITITFVLEYQQNGIEYYQSWPAYKWMWWFGPIILGLILTLGMWWIVSLVAIWCVSDMGWQESADVLMGSYGYGSTDGWVDDPQLLPGSRSYEQE